MLPNVNSSECLAGASHFFRQLIHKLRDLDIGSRRNRVIVEPRENTTSDGLSQEHNSNRPRPRPRATGTQDGNQTTMSFAESAKTFGFIGGSKDEASIKLMPQKAQAEDELVNHFSDDEEDVCPTCLEEYNNENPKITANCNHHFHLGCIYEWKERSDRCPVCYRVMAFEEAF